AAAESVRLSARNSPTQRRSTAHHDLAGRSVGGARLNASSFVYFRGRLPFVCSTIPGPSSIGRRSAAAGGVFDLASGVLGLVRDLLSVVRGRGPQVLGSALS